MTVDYDPIPELRKLGYTEREAAFLYLVGIHSGYFLRRQYLAFIQREDGAMVQRFLEKAIRFEHVHPIEYAVGRHIYHLKSKLVYRILEQEDSQNRRAKGDRQIKARLLQVDYLLDHFGEQLLGTAQQKVKFFCDKLKVPAEALPQVRYQNTSAPVYLADRFPIAIEQKPGQSVLTVSFVFIDDGLRSISAFVRWLEQHTPLLQALDRAEVVYVADSKRNFVEAERQFLRRFPPNPVTRELPFGVDHFVSYLRIRTRYDQQGGGFSLSDLRILNEGMEQYTTLEQQALLAAWRVGSTNEAKTRAGFEPRIRQVTIKSWLLEHDYPIWSMKYRRAVL